MIKRQFPNVIKVSNKVLDFLADCMPTTEASPRKLRMLIKSFANVQYGVVNLTNIPYILSNDDDSTSTQEIMVRIV